MSRIDTVLRSLWIWMDRERNYTKNLLQVKQTEWAKTEGHKKMEKHKPIFINYKGSGWPKLNIPVCREQIAELVAEEESLWANEP